MGTVTFDHETVYAYILGFNHNSIIEGNGITFGGFKTAAKNGIDIALCDSHINSINTTGQKWFNVNHYPGGNQYGHNFFARNDDGEGRERGYLTREIKSILQKKDNGYQARWDKVWEDDLCQKYKRHEHKDHWLWNHKFYNADIEDLKYIYQLIGGK